MNGHKVPSDASRLYLPVATVVIIIGSVMSGTWWVSKTLGGISSEQTRQLEKQSETAALLAKIDGRTESFPLIARRVDQLEQTNNSFSNVVSQTALDIRTLQLQVDEIKRAQSDDRVILRGLSDWRTSLLNKAATPQ